MTRPARKEMVFLRGDLRPRPDYFANLALNLSPAAGRRFERYD